MVREVGAAWRGLGTPTYAYVNLDTLARQTESGGTTHLVYVAAADRSDSALRTFSQQIESRFDAAGLRRIQAQLTVDGVTGADLTGGARSIITEWRFGKRATVRSSGSENRTTVQS